MNSAPQSVQSAAYKIVLDKQVGEYNLHKNVAIICAGNLATDKAIVNRSSTAMQSRLIHFELDVSHIDWAKWAVKNKLDYRVIAFLRFRPELLHKFDPNHKGNTFPCPRTWEFMSKLVKGTENLPATILPLLAGTVGEGPGAEFRGFAEIFTRLPTLNQIMTAPNTIEVPTDPSILFAITALISNSLNTTNAEQLMKFVNRLPIEFQAITLQGVIEADSKMLKNPNIKIWIAANANELMD